MPRPPLRPRTIRFLDVVVILVSLAVVAVLSVRAYGDRGTTGLLRIESPNGSWVYPLDQDRTVTVQGPIGKNVIVIHAGEARVVEADCRDKICISMGKISRPGSWVACLPNRVFLRVLGTDAATDAVTY